MFFSDPLQSPISKGVSKSSLQQMAVSPLLHCYSGVRNQTKVNSSVSLGVNTVQEFGTEQRCSLEGNGQVSP